MHLQTPHGGSGRQLPGTRRGSAIGAVRIALARSGIADAAHPLSGGDADMVWLPQNLYFAA